MFSKKVVGKVLIGGLLALGLPVSSVSANVVYSGGFDPASPVSWAQGSAPYSNVGFRYCSEGTFGPCSCGMHTLAVLLLKSEYWDAGKLATDAYLLSESNGIGSNYNGIPAYNWSKVEGATGGYLKYEGAYWPSSREDAKSILRQIYANGQYAVISVTINGVGHLVALDYVEDDGDVVIVDSAIRAKYLDQMDGGGVHYIQAFSSAIPSNQAAHFWQGDKIGKYSYNTVMNALQTEANQIESELNNIKTEEEAAAQRESILTKIDLLASGDIDTAEFLSDRSKAEVGDGFVLQDVTAEQ